MSTSRPAHSRSHSHARGRSVQPRLDDEYSLNESFSFGLRSEGAPDSPLAPDHSQSQSHSHPDSHSHSHSHSDSHSHSHSHSNSNSHSNTHSHSHSDSHSLSHQGPPSLLQIKNPFVSEPNDFYHASKQSVRDLDTDGSNSLLIQLIGTLPVLLAFPSLLLSALLAYNPADKTVSYSSSAASASISILLASSFLLIASGLLKLNVVSLSRNSSTSSSDADSSKQTGLVLLAISSIYFTPRLLSVNRLSVLFLGLFCNQLNPYTILAFMYDVFQNYHSQLELTSTISGYILVLLSFKFLFRKLTLTSLSKTLQNLDTVLLVSALLSSLFILTLSSSGNFSIMMIGVNVAASVVFMISLPDSFLRYSRLNPVIISLFSISLEFIVLSTPVTPLHFVIKVIAPIVINPDRSVPITQRDDEVIPDSASSNSILRELLSHSDTRAIFNFLLLNTAFMFVQLLYSFRSKSLGLLSDSLHMALDCTSLALGLVAGILSKYPVNPNGKFPFGLKHFEILAGFTNGTLLIGISGSIIFEAIGRLFNPVSLQKTTELIIVSFLGLLVNLIGIFAFNHGHDGHSHGHSHSHGDTHGHSHGHSHTDTVADDDCDNNHGMNDNMKGIFLHILADTLGSVGVVISTILIKYLKWEGFDPIASIIIAVLIFLSAVPLIKSTASTLLLKLNSDKEAKLRSVLNDLVTIKGIKSFTTPRFWPSSENSTLNGYIHIQVYRGENGSYIKKQCERIFVAANINVMLQVENDYDDCWCRSAEPAERRL